MGTSSKLDPSVRTESAQRARIIRSIERTAKRVTGIHRLNAELVLTLLLDIQRNPSLTGRQKTREFLQIIKQLETP